jgi:hypothetical protein
LIRCKIELMFLTLAMSYQNKGTAGDVTQRWSASLAHARLWVLTPTEEKKE